MLAHTRTYKLTTDKFRVEIGRFLAMKQWIWSELWGQCIHQFCWSSINLLQDHLTSFCKDCLWVQSPTMSVLLNTDRARDRPLALRPTGTDWLMFILGLPSAIHCPWPWVSSRSTSQESHETTQLFCMSQFKGHKEVRRLLCSPPERDFQSMKQSMCCTSASVAWGEEEG